MRSTSSKLPELEICPIANEQVILIVWPGNELFRFVEVQGEEMVLVQEDRDTGTAGNNRIHPRASKATFYSAQVNSQSS